MESEVKILLSLKTQYKELTGKDVGGAQREKKDKKVSKENVKPAEKKETVKDTKDDVSQQAKKKQTR